MLPPNKIILPCGNAAELHPNISATYICNYCHNVVGSSDEPTACKAKREKAEPFKNDYWMNIHDNENDR